MALRELPYPTQFATDPPIQWDDAPCPLCGRTSSGVAFEARDPLPPRGPGLVFAVVTCKTCGLSYTNPRPDCESIAGFYPSDYRPHRSTRSRMRTGPPRWVSRITGRKVPERIGDLPWQGRGRLLDFGCGSGDYLRRMADRGWSVTGIDLSASAVQAVHDELSLQAVTGTLPHPDLAPGTFDVVTMWHSLEHVHEPLTLLRDTYDLLVPGGRLIVAVPNLASWPAKWFGPTWFGLDLPRHLTHFTPRTLREMLATAGYEIESFRMIRHSEWLRTSARRTIAAQPDSWMSPLAFKPVAKAVAWLSYLFGKSDCQMAVARRPIS